VPGLFRTLPIVKIPDLRYRNGKTNKIAIFMLKMWSKVCCNCGRTSQGDVVGRDFAHYIAQLIYTCFCAYTIQARSTTNGKIGCEIQNPQMFQTNSESFSPAFGSRSYYMTSKNSIFVREHGVHAGPKDYFVVVVVVVICG
jgi:hypothetical protein